MLWRSSSLGNRLFEIFKEIFKGLGCSGETQGRKIYLKVWGLIDDTSPLCSSVGKPVWGRERCSSQTDGCDDLTFVTGKEVWRKCLRSVSQGGPTNISSLYSMYLLFGHGQILMIQDFPARKVSFTSFQRINLDSNEDPKITPKGLRHTC